MECGSALPSPPTRETISETVSRLITQPSTECREGRLLREVYRTRCPEITSETIYRQITQLSTECREGRLLREVFRTRCSEITSETDIGQTTLMSSLVPRPRPAFRHLQYLTLSFSFARGESLGTRLSDESIFAALSTSMLSLQRLAVNVTYS